MRPCGKLATMHDLRRSFAAVFAMSLAFACGDDASESDSDTGTTGSSSGSGTTGTSGSSTGGVEASTTTVAASTETSQTASGTTLGSESESESSGALDSSGSTGGASDSDGSTAGASTTGGESSETTAETGTDLVPTCVSMIDDFEDENTEFLPPEDGRSGAWYTDPVEVIATVGEEDDAGSRVRHALALGELVFGFRFGANLLEPRAPYDASEYDGIMFRALDRSLSEGTWSLMIPTADVIYTGDGGTCTGNDFGCNVDPHRATLETSGEWTDFVLGWDQFAVTGAVSPSDLAFEPSEIMSIVWNFDPYSPPDNTADLYIDDVCFYRLLPS